MAEPNSLHAVETANLRQQAPNLPGAESHPLITHPNSGEIAAPQYGSQPSYHTQPNYHPMHAGQGGYLPVQTVPQYQVYAPQHNQPQLVMQSDQMFDQVQPANYVLIPAADDPNFLDMGPPPAWFLDHVSFTENCLRNLTRPCIFRNSLSKYSLQHPQNDETQIVASAVCCHLEVASCNNYPLVFPQTGYRLLYNPGSLIASACSQEELVEFVEKANDKTKDFIHRTNQSNQCTALAFFINHFVMTIAAIVVFEVKSFGWKGYVALIGYVMIFLIVKYFCVKRLSDKLTIFQRDLATWIKEHRGPFYAKGVRPRIGYNGAFLVFEANLAKIT